MLTQGTWQGALGTAALSVIIFSTSILLSLVSGFFGWYSILIGIFLFIGFYVIITILPLLLNLSRSFYWIIFALLIIHISITILSFALNYHSTGLLGSKGKFAPSFYDSLYFSITTFTTLGYGDIRPLPSYRLTTSLEALIGMVSMALGASVIWLWCQENLIPKEIAYFDGNRRHKTSLGITRLRIRTMTGKEHNLTDWYLPAKPGETYRYDDLRQEWISTPEKIEPLEDAAIMSIDHRD
ncbi:MAG TPA: ion channel [Burkholderiaceae bacterium]|nr:ion channel [Burkholderiaceae bacterium]